MIEQLILVTLIATFIDLVLWKWQIWPIIGATKLTAKVVDCELCRSFWLVGGIGAIFFAANILPLAWYTILIWPMSTVLKLFIQSYIDG